MFRLSDVNALLKSNFTTYAFYNGTYDRAIPCIGIFLRDVSNPAVIAVGGISNTSYNVLRTSLLVHWNENTDESEIVADNIYEYLIGKVGLTVGAKQVLFVEVEGNGPISLSRDENNICEFVVHANFYYQR